MPQSIAIFDSGKRRGPNLNTGLPGIF